MHFTSAAATLLLGASCAVAAPCSKARTFYNGTCTAETVTIRKEWRNLAESEQASYLEAVNCLMELPANTSLSGVTNRFSDLQATHRDKTNATVNGVFVGDIIHSVVSAVPITCPGLDL
jgi:tyrosinase